MIQSGDEPVPGYRLEQLLGRGQYGEVWRATTPGRSTIALKFLDLTGLHGRKEFRSAQRVKQIRHAHLMPIVAIWMLDRNGNVLDDDAMVSLSDEESASLKTIALSSVANPVSPAKMIIATPLGDLDLRDRMEQCQKEGLPGIPPEELIDYMQEAAKGLDYLNSEQHDWRGTSVGVQHCDIKPDNIMLVGGSVVICDFGVAQVMADYGGGVRATSLSGSPAYMSPEAFEAKPTRTSDQYSLAATYYELRTGELPVYGESFAEVYDAHRSGKLNFSLVPKPEQDVLRRATNPNPERRYPSSAEFVQELRTAVLGTAPQKRKLSLIGLGVLGAVLLIAASVGAFTMLYWQERDVKVKLSFNVPDMQVVVNEKEFKADGDGSVNLEAPANEALKISCDGDRFHAAKEWTIAAGELVKKKSFHFKLPFNAAYHAAKAEKLIAEGNTEAAAKEYADAISEEPQRYARFPEPAFLEIDPIDGGDCFQITPNGEWLVVGDKNGAVRRWKIGPKGIEAESEALYKHDKSIVSLVATDELVASVSNNHSIWVTLDGEAMRLEKQSIAETDPEAQLGDAGLAITCDGQWIVAALAASGVTELFAWKVDSIGTAKLGIALGEQPGEFPVMVGSADDSVSLATMDDKALIWRWKVQPAEHSELGRQQNDVFTLSASKDGNTIAYAGGANSNSNSPEAAIVDVDTNIAYQLPQTNLIQASTIDDDGQFLITSEQMPSPATVDVWRRNAMQRIALVERALPFDKQLDNVSALACSAGAEWIAAGHDQGAVTLWHSSDSSAVPLLSFGKGKKVIAVRITPDQRWLIGGAEDGQVLIFDLQRLDMIQRACEQADEQPTIGEDKVTLRDRPAKRGLRFLWACVETWFRLPAHPNA